MCIQCELLAALKQRFKYSRTIMAPSRGTKGRGGVARQLVVHLDVYLLVQEVHTTAEALPLGRGSNIHSPDPCFLLSSAAADVAYTQSATGCTKLHFQPVLYRFLFIFLYSESVRERETRIYTYMRIFRESKNIFGKSVSFLLLKSARIFAAYFWPALASQCTVSLAAFHFR